LRQINRVVETGRMSDVESTTRFAFETKLIEWRGPAPFVYAPLPAPVADDLRSASRTLSYGWGCIPVAAEIGGVGFTTSLFPKDGGYLLPLKVAVRRKTGVTVGDTVAIEMTINATLRER
jgi:hypothetical protein